MDLVEMKQATNNPPNKISTQVFFPPSPFIQEDQTYPNLD